MKSEGAKPKRSLKKIIREVYIYAVLLVIVLVFSCIGASKGTPWFGRGHFLGSASIISMARQAAPIITLACGFTFVMVAGYMDLSVGSAMGLTQVIYAIAVRAGFPFLGGLAVAVGVGILCGIINGIIVGKLRITPVIATLVTMTVFKGIAILLVPEGISAIKSTDTQKMPAWISDYGRAKTLFGLPPAFYVALLIVAAIVIIQHKTLLGKYAQAIGGNVVSAELAGINTVKYVMLIYIITGILAAFAGVAQASYNSLGNPLGGTGFETDCIIAVLLGGTAFEGGEGSAFKSVIGAIIIICITVGMLTVVEAYYQGFLKGAILIAAVSLNQILNKEESMV
ncbi:MAG: ABC transporter permease [Coriobacteriaceae bacterium]|nr:ABC transporter permease [Coriobacteriaceae bacterium]